MVKNLPNSILNDEKMCKDFLPLNFINKFNTLDGKLKKLSTNLWDHYAEAVGKNDELSEMLADSILAHLTTSFDSS